jgi:hypothetical protein
MNDGMVRTGAVIAISKPSVGFKGNDIIILIGLNS